MHAVYLSSKRFLFTMLLLLLVVPFRKATNSDVPGTRLSDVPGTRLSTADCTQNIDQYITPNH